jgi:hypothetical protein
MARPAYRWKQAPGTSGFRAPGLSGVLAFDYEQALLHETSLS